MNQVMCCDCARFRSWIEIGAPKPEDVKDYDGVCCYDPPKSVPTSFVVIPLPDTDSEYIDRITVAIAAKLLQNLPGRYPAVRNDWTCRKHVAR